MNCLREENLKNCTCTYFNCEKAGICCACVRHHRAKKQIPGCFFSEDGEKTFDRSVEKFIKDQTQTS